MVSLYKNTDNTPFKSAEKSSLIEHTTRLVRQIFGSDKVKISLCSESTFSPAAIESNFVQQYIYDARHNELVIGIISLYDVPAGSIISGGAEILESLMKGFARELEKDKEIIANTELIQRNLLALEQTKKELENVYEDLNLAHEELSDAVNMTILLNRNLSRSRIAVKSFLKTAPIAFAVLRHRHLKIELANPLILKLWGRNKSVLGKTLEKALPELQGQHFLTILDQVYTSGNRYLGSEEKVQLEVEGKLQDLYFNFIYEPLKNEKGETTAIMIIANDVTELVNARKTLAQASLDGYV